MLLQSDGRLPARIAAPKSVAEGPCQTMTNAITGAIQARVWSGIGVAIGLLIVVIAGAHAVPAGARYRPGRGGRGAARKVDPGGRDRRRLRARRLRHTDLLRFLRPAHDRPGCGALSDRGAGKLHQLLHRPQSRRDCLHRRGNQISDLFRLGLGHHRCRQDRLRHRTDVLARQRVPARVRHVVRACGRERRQSIAPVDQPR